MINVIQHYFSIHGIIRIPIIDDHGDNIKVVWYNLCRFYFNRVSTEIFLNSIEAKLKSLKTKFGFISYIGKSSNIATNNFSRITTDGCSRRSVIVREDSSPSIADISLHKT